MSEDRESETDISVRPGRIGIRFRNTPKSVIAIVVIGCVTIVWLLTR